MRRPTQIPSVVAEPVHGLGFFVFSKAPFYGSSPHYQSSWPLVSFEQWEGPLIVLPISTMNIRTISSGLLCGFGIVALVTSTQDLSAQGCVIARGGGGVMVLGGDGLLEPHQWQTGLNYRWLQSDRHFRGTDEEEHRQRDGTEVIGAENGR